MRTVGLTAVLFCSSLAAANVFEMPPGLSSLEMVVVGNPRNAPDTRYGSPGYGSVAYAYYIGKYEVTAGQYCEFLNAVAKTDTYGLYNTHMDPDADPAGLGCNIKRTAGPNGWEYSVASDWANRPVNYVSWGDAARFCNWIANDQPTGAQDLSTTEDGSYYLNGATSDTDLATVGRKLDAKYVIPGSDEWYKAAYHKNDGPTGNYFAFPTSSNDIPSNVLDPDGTNNANYYGAYGSGNGGWTIGSPYYRSEVGAFAGSPSPYGTFDQGGNVYEWNETLSDGLYRILCGNSFSSNGFVAYDVVSLLSTYEREIAGFRVAWIPEPVGVIEGPVVNPANQHSYYLLDRSTWTSAENEAVLLGGHLATIRSQAEQDWVYQGFGFGQRDLWIGFFDREADNSFAWASGEAVTYTNWYPGEPNHATEQYACMYRLWDGGWADTNDASNQNLAFGVVEIAPSPSIVAWRSVRFHTVAGGVGADLSIPLNPLGLWFVSETRLGGIQQIEVDFDGVIQLTQTATIGAENTSAGTVYPATSASLTNGDTTLVIRFAGGLPDQACYRIDLAGDIVNLAGDTDCLVAGLVGEVNGDHFVNLTDFAYDKSKMGEPVFPDNIRFDINHDFHIDLTDMAVIRSRGGNSVR